MYPVGPELLDSPLLRGLGVLKDESVRRPDLEFGSFVRSTLNVEDRRLRFLLDQSAGVPGGGGVRDPGEDATDGVEGPSIARVTLTVLTGPGTS